MKQKSILFLTLYTYSFTGGIENVCKNLIKVLGRLKESKVLDQILTLSMHDEAEKKPDYSSFNGNKTSFGISAIKNGLRSEIIILSHINLLIFAKIIRTFKPTQRVVLFAHGIEIWDNLPTWKTTFLKTIEIWSVGSYTAKAIEKRHGLPQQHIRVLNNSLGETFQFLNKTKPQQLIDEHHILESQKILLTVCRLSSSEQYKGYDLVLLALKDLVKLYPNLLYFIVGKADELEKNRIDKLITTYNLQKNVICTGYLSDEDLIQYYSLADVFVMPSKGEGFGLVFIEAVANGCHVLAGNVDGSVDALLNGELGLLVDPESVEDIYGGLLNLLNNPLSDEEILRRQEKVRENFGFEVYLEKVKALLN